MLPSTSGGIFRHTSFGMMDKLGTWTAEPTWMELIGFGLTAYS